jgi:hypothetical protein
LAGNELTVVRIAVNKKSPSVETERPLTIACHMKILNQTPGRKRATSNPWSRLENYLVVSVCVVSIMCEDVSVIMLLPVSAGIVLMVSVPIVLVESVVVELVPLLQAANAPIAKTINSFFICVFFL